MTAIAAPRIAAGGAAAGFKFVASERWGVTSVVLENPDPQPAEVLVAVTFPKTEISNVQYAHKIWLAPQSRRTLLIPIRSPKLSRVDLGVEIKIVLLSGARGHERRLHDAAGTLLINNKTPTLATMILDESAGSLMSDVRKKANKDMGLSSPQPDTLPWLTPAWRTIDCLIVGRPDMDLDEVQLEAMRQWLLSGGRLWVMLDLVDPTFLRQLVGNDLECEIVDRVAVDSFPLEEKQTGNNRFGQRQKSVFVHGQLTTPDPKTKLPVGWKLTDGEAESVQLRGGLKVQSDESGSTTLLQSELDVDRRWNTLKVSTRMFTQKLEGSGSVYGGTFKVSVLNSAGKVIAKPIEVVEGENRNWTAHERQIELPPGASRLRFEVGLMNAKGTMQLQRILVQPLGLSFDEPVEMVRVIAPKMEVLREIDGWPAALRQNVGQGQLYMTTVGARFWAAEMEADRDGLESIARQFMKSRPSDALASEHLQPFAHEQIGHSIVSREPVIVVLGIYAGLLLAGGLFFMRKDRMEIAAVIGVVLSLVVVGVLTAMGTIKRNETPLTLASAQFVQVLPSQQQAVVSGVVSVYSPRADQGPLSATAGGVVWPDRTGQEGKLLRMVWTDMDQWKWDFLELPSGAVRTSELDHVARLENTVRVEIDCQNGALQGTVSAGPFAPLSDTLLTGPNGNLLPRFTSDTTFELTRDDVLAKGQYFGGAALTDTQQRRQAVFRQLMERGELDRTRSRFPFEASLVWWAKSMDLGFDLPQETEHREAAIVSVPITFKQPAKGAKVSVPSELIPYVVVREPGGEIVSSVYMPQQGIWAVNQMTAGTSFTMRFTVPQELLPLQISDLKLWADLKAQGRELEIINPFNKRQIGSKENVSGRVTFDLTDQKQLHPDKDGHVYVDIRIGDPPNATAGSSSFWEIRGFGLDVDGIAR